MTMAALMQSVIVGWQIYSITQNVLWLGFIGLTEVIPQISISLFADQRGHVDGHDGGAAEGQRALDERLAADDEGEGRHPLDAVPLDGRGELRSPVRAATAVPTTETRSPTR